MLKLRDRVGPGPERLKEGVEDEEEKRLRASLVGPAEVWGSAQDCISINVRIAAHSTFKSASGPQRPHCGGTRMMLGKEFKKHAVSEF